MRISHKLILGFLVIALMAGVSGYFDIMYGNQIKKIFIQIEEEEIPSKTNLLEIKAAARQASIKAMEYSLRGSLNDKQKAEEAILKVKQYADDYHKIERHEDMARKARLTKISDAFISELEKYLQISEGPSRSTIIADEAGLHQARKELIAILKDSKLNENNTSLALYREQIKSEARKVSIKAIEYYLRGDDRDKIKATVAVKELDGLNSKLQNMYSGNLDLAASIHERITSFISVSTSYLHTISQRRVPVSVINQQENKVHKVRKELIHTLYDLIQQEHEELLRIEDSARNTINYATRISIISVTLAIAAAIILGIFLARSISGSIQQLNTAAQKISEGNLDVNINIKSNDEIGELAASFEQMTYALKTSRTELMQTSAHLKNEAAERNQLIEQQNKRHEEMMRNQEALLSWAKVDYLNLEQALHNATELSAKTINTDRVSVWLFNSDHTAIVCEDLYILTRNKHEKGMQLEAIDYPNYFKALLQNRTLPINDARAEPETSEFTEGYLKPLGIYSMMDVPIRREGQVVGVVCHEHTGPVREWTLEQQDFAASIASTVALALEANERKLAEVKLKSHLDHLEEIVEERTNELRSVNQELESFSYSVSHDLRAPLRAIDGFSLVLLEDYADAVDDQGKDYLQRIRSSTQRMGELIADLLELSHLSQAALDYEAVDLSAMAESILSNLSVMHEERAVSYHVHETEPAMCDPGLIRVVLENLLGNAWKYTAKTESPTIDFGMKNDTDGTVYYVKDNGAGFDMKYASKLFGAFQRLHGKEFEGTGIGLATVKKVINRHGGRIWAEANVNHGATFYFTLGKRTELRAIP